VARFSLSFMKLYAQAGTVVLCDYFLPAASCRKKKETKVIQLWHACGCFKKFGYDAKDDIPENYHGDVCRNLSLVTVSGEAAVGPFTSAMRRPAGVVQALGVSRTDLFFDEAWRDGCRREFYEKYPEAKGKKIVLWAPTFRGNAGSPKSVLLDLRRLSRALGEDWLVLTRPHPHMYNLLDMPSGAKADFLCHLPTERMFPAVDVLIADYSSLIYEYALFEKPLVLYCPDLKEYEKQRGFYMPITEIPAKIVEDEEKLAGAVKAAGAAACSYKNTAAGSGSGSYVTPGTKDDSSQLSAAGEMKADEKYRDFLRRYMGACDGHATERIVEWLKSNSKNT